MREAAVIYFCLCLCALISRSLGQCAQDYECGNIPYTLCNGGVNDCPTTVPGLGIDSNSKQIYFAQVCRTDTQLSNITIKRVAASGGLPVAVQTRQQFPAAVNPGYFFDKVGDLLYYSIQSRGPGQLLTSLNVTTLTENTIDTGAFFQNAIDFDISNGLTFVCNLFFTNLSSNYTVDRFDGILGQGTAERHILYYLPFLSACTGVRKQGNDLYFSTLQYTFNSTDFTAKVYKGSSDCEDCAAPQLLFSLSEQRINGFDVTATRIYYGTATGVFSSDFSGGDIQHVSWSSGATGVRILEDRVYWNSGVAIISASLDGSDVKQVNQFNGSCGCRQGFIGSNCVSCGGQVQWYEGLPSCVALGADGYPVTCNFDYECANSPYSYCSGTCSCREGLTGANCNQCINPAESIVWQSGIPTCQ